MFAQPVKLVVGRSWFLMKIVHRALAGAQVKTP
jgi:hypothetical protein